MLLGILCFSFQFFACSVRVCGRRGNLLLLSLCTFSLPCFLSSLLHFLLASNAITVSKWLFGHCCAGNKNLFPRSLQSLCHYFNLAGFKQNPASDTLSPPPLPLLSAHHFPDLAVPNSQLPFASHNRQQQQLERKTGAYCAPNS